jgi:hypothetical protein
MTDETPIAQTAKSESKPATVRKTAKKKSRAKKATKKDSHGGRPRLLTTYWIEVLKDPKLRGKDRADAIREFERCLKEETRKKLARSTPNPNSSLRSILDRSTKTDSQATAPIAEIAKNAQSAKPQTEEAAPQEVSDAPAEPKPLTFDDVMAEITKPSGKTRDEEVAEIAARLRDVPAPGYDTATETRIWAAVHGMKVR